MLFVVLPGFEPRQADPESDVLPLHHRTIPISNYEFRMLKFGFHLSKAGAKVLTFFDMDKKNEFFLPLHIQTSVSQWVLLFILCCHPSCNTNQNSTSNTAVSQKFIAAKGYRCPWRLQFCPNHSFSIILHHPPLPPCRTGRR